MLSFAAARFHRVAMPCLSDFSGRLFLFLIALPLGLPTRKIRAVAGFFSFADF
jgi:hypothetical protein